MYFLCMFGCVVHVKITDGYQQELNDYNTPMVFIGYESSSMACRFYNLNTKRIHISCDVESERGKRS